MQLIQITDKTGKKLEEKTLDLAVVREKLAESKGQAYWRSLEELSEEPGFDELLRREFPGQAPKDWAPLARRDFVKLMGAALALAGLSGCAFQPQEKIVPYVDAPEESVTGIPLFYATAIPFMGYGLGVLAESHEGRPTKLEGNPDHSVSGGAADIWTQASILEMYDPDRSQIIRQSGASSSWDEVSGVLAKAVAEAKRNGGGSDLALLTGTITSPTMLAEIAELQSRLPNMQWVSYEEINSDNRRAGAKLAFGKDVHTLHHFDRASVIVSLDSDFLLEEPGRVAHAREFVAGRSLLEPEDTATAKKGDVKSAASATMNRLYVIESTPTITGSNADHRFPVKASEVDGIARALAQAVGVSGVTGEVPEVAKKWLGAIVDDLKANSGKVLVIAGAQQPASVHAIAHAINTLLKSTGDPKSSPVTYHTPIEGNPTLHVDGLKKLVDSMHKGQIKTLVVMGTNPAYSAPADLKFADAMKRVKLTVHSGAHEDETSSLCLWHVPEAHFLEYWGDVCAVDGTTSIIQPLIQPLYEAAKAPSQILAALLAEPEGVLTPKFSSYASPYELTRAYWQGRPEARANQKVGEDPSLSFDRFWSKAVHDGYLNTPATPAAVSLQTLNLGPAVTPISGLEVNFRPDGTMWDGRFANNPWLQECPKPYSRITWDNAVFVSPDTAFANNWATNQEVTVSVNGQSITGAIFMLPGQPNNTLTLHLGYGRQYSGKICTADDGGVRGFNASALRTQANSWWIGGATVTPTGRVYKIATTSNHNLIAPGGKNTTLKDALLKSDNSKTHIIDNIIEPEEDLDIDGTHRRDLVRTGTFEDFKAGKLPTRPSDKRAIPITWPKNLEEFRKNELEPGVPGGKSTVDDRGRPAWQEDRELEGNPSFYPRDSDYLAQTPYRDPALNQTEAPLLAATLPDKKHDGLTQQWGMSVDINSCIGCNACVVACQSENNSATVGKDQILMGRELHWIRIDTYYRGSFENPEVYFEPMMCQHCEKAPCAPVCPFNATMITPDGINEQVYNRCVGTKYCENNCPYKVRRFNFLQYSDQQNPVIQLMANPDVTVRSRGVMEKCTYCIQRVNGAKWQAEKEGRYVRDGEIQTACAQTCPTNAIVFGDINDPNSEVSRRKRGALTFGILTDLNTMPRTTYMAKFRNPNPALVKLGEEFAAETMHGEVEDESEEGAGEAGAAE